MMLCRVIRGADLHLALRARFTSGALLDDVRELVRHQTEIESALAGSEEDVRAIREGACGHRARGRLCAGIIMHADVAKVRPELRLGLRADAGIDLASRVLVLHRGRGDVVDAGDLVGADRFPLGAIEQPRITARGLKLLGERRPPRRAQTIDVAGVGRPSPSIPPPLHGAHLSNRTAGSGAHLRETFVRRAALRSIISAYDRRAFGRRAITTCIDMARSRPGSSRDARAIAACSSGSPGACSARSCSDGDRAARSVACARARVARPAAIDGEGGASYAVRHALRANAYRSERATATRPAAQLGLEPVVRICARARATYAGLA